VKQRFCIRVSDGANLGAYHPVTAAKPGIRVEEMEVTDPKPKAGKRRPHATDAPTLRVEGEVVRDQYNQVVDGPLRTTLDDLSAEAPAALSQSPAPPPAPVACETFTSPGAEPEYLKMPVDEEQGTVDVKAWPYGFKADASQKELLAYAKTEYGLDLSKRLNARSLVFRLKRVEDEKAGRPGPQ
jgi:hypothetical protein